MYTVFSSLFQVPREFLNVSDRMIKNKIIYGAELPDIPKQSVGSLFFEALERGDDEICQLDVVTGEKETYHEVKTRSVRVAIALRQRGVTSEDVICFCTRNTMDSCIPIIASFFLGAKVANLEPSLSLRNTKHLISLVTPKIIFVEETSLGLIEESLEQLHLDTELVVFGQSEKHLIFDEFTKPQKEESLFLPVEVDLEDIALIFFSSGTTGLPKAICHSHTSSSYFLNDTSPNKSNRAISEIFLHFTTMYWISGLSILGTCIQMGATRAFFSRPINGQETFESIEKYKISMIFMAPSLTYELTNTKNYQDYDTSSLKIFLTGGSAIAVPQVNELQKMFPQGHVLPAYGMTELFGICAMPSKQMVKQKPGSCGKVTRGRALKIRDPDTGLTLGVNEKGEICAKGPGMMMGYYNIDSSDTFDGKGFLKTGDIGYYDEDGFIYVIDRIKEMFKYLSWHIVPSSLEAVLHEHRAVQEAVVFGLPQGEDGDVPAAWVILREDHSNVSSEEIEQFVAERVSDKERLRGGITIVRSIPRTPNGKVNRSEIRNIALKAILE